MKPKYSPPTYTPVAPKYRLPFVLHLDRDEHMQLLDTVTDREHGIGYIPEITNALQEVQVEVTITFPVTFHLDDFNGDDTDFPTHQKLQEAAMEVVRATHLCTDPKTMTARVLGS